MSSKEVCRSYRNRGVCRWGDACVFEHSHGPPLLHKAHAEVADCFVWREAGFCQFGAKCRFRHGEDDARFPGGMKDLSTEVCRNFKKGRCRLGEHCPRKHEEPTVRKCRIHSSDRSESANTSFDDARVSTPPLPSMSVPTVLAAPPSAAGRAPLSPDEQLYKLPGDSFGGGADSSRGVQHVHYIPDLFPEEFLAHLDARRAALGFEDFSHLMVAKRRFFRDEALAAELLAYVRAGCACDESRPEGGWGRGQGGKETAGEAGEGEASLCSSSAEAPAAASTTTTASTSLPSSSTTAAAAAAAVVAAAAAGPATEGAPRAPSGAARLHGTDVSLLSHVNCELRFLEYTGGGFIKPHRDGTAVDPITLQPSTTSFLLYLSDVDDGGETEFLSSLDAYGEPPLFSIKPRRGAIAIFPHSVPHQGTAVSSAFPKTVLRGEMY